jgi:3D-(3,5/4)-trihydroxycyclohexane-1,2-dione acylhydrolase (decyclizing)
MYPAHFFQKRVYTVERPTVSPAALRGAVELIRASRSPVIVAGGGVHYSDATDALARFTTATGLPVGVTQAGKGALLDAHESCLGAIGVTGTAAANSVAADADLVLVIGTRLSDFTTASKSLFQHPRVRFIGININSADAHKHGALPLVGDARAILLQLARALVDWRVPSAHLSAVQRARERWSATRATLVAPQKGGLTQAQVIDELNQACGANGTVVHASGGIPGDIHKLWRSRAANDYHSEYGYSCMGYEIAGALGVKLAAPGREVYAFLGDGSYLMLHTEIVTAVQENVKLTIVLNDNHGYGCIHNLQRGSGGKSFGNEFRARLVQTDRLEGNRLPVDFAKNAESLGAKSFRVTTATELRDAFAAAKKENGTVLIYVPVQPDATLPGYAWWDVPVSATSKVPGVKAARRAYDRAVEKQRFHY